MPNKARPDFSALADAWPKVEASIRAIEAKRRPSDEPPILKHPRTTLREIMDMRLRDVIYAWGNPDSLIDYARRYSGGRWSRTSLGDCRWIVERVE